MKKNVSGCFFLKTVYMAKSLHGNRSHPNTLIAVCRGTISASCVPKSLVLQKLIVLCRRSSSRPRRCADRSFGDGIGRAKFIVS